MEHIKLLPPNCKQTVSITPGEGCLSFKNSSKRETSRLETNPFLSQQKQKQKTKPKRKKPASAKATVASSNVDDDLDLLMNPAKRKTQDQKQEDADKLYSGQSENLFATNKKKKKKKSQSKYISDSETDSDSEQPNYSSNSDESGGSDFDDSEESDDESSNHTAEPMMSRTEIVYRKAQLLARLKRREKFTGKKIDYNPDGTLEHLEIADATHSYEANSAMSVTVMRQVLMFAVGNMESMSQTLTFLRVDLTGWTESVCLSLDTYNEIFFEIYDYYSSNFHVNPLLKLGVAVTSSAMMHSLQRQLFSNAKFTTRQQPVTPEQQQPSATTTHATQQGYNSSIPPVVHYSDVKEPIGDDEVGEMSGPDEVSEQQLLEQFRKEQDSKVSISSIQLPENEIKEVTVSVPVTKTRGRKDTKKQPTTRGATASTKNVVSIN